MVSISTRIRRFDALLAIAEAHDNVFCSVGTHPHYAHEELDVPVDEIVRLCRASQGGGHRRGGARLLLRQQSASGAGAGASATTSPPRARPSCRSSSTPATPTTTWPRSWKRRWQQGAFPAVLHCFTGGAELARRGLELGLYVSFSGILTFKKSDALREHRPGGAARPSAGGDRRAVPGARQVPWQAQRAGLSWSRPPPSCARVKGVAPDELAQATTENFFRLYNKTPRPVVAP